jgi:hypothetical protein
MILSASCLIGIVTISIGVWVPFAFESVAWKQDLERPVLGDSKETQVKSGPLILKYPLLRMISRIRLGAQIHSSRIKLAHDLPALLNLIKEQKLADAEALLLDLFSIGAFDENTELVIWLQKTLKETSQLNKGIVANQKTLEVIQEDQDQMITGWQKLISDFREYLHLSSGLENNSTENQNRCNPDDCEKYEQGPLRGLPLQPELPEAPESLENFAKWYIKRLSSQEKEKITDEAITQPLVSFREKASALTKYYRQNKASHTTVRNTLSEDRKLVKENAYLMKTKLEDMIRTASAPPEIIFDDLLI